MVYKRIALIFLLIITMVGCNSNETANQLKNVGLLVPETIHDQVWGTKGYKGLLGIQSKLGVDVFYKEGITSEPLVKRAVKEMSEKEVNLIIGHSHQYAEYFNELAHQYPNIQFVSINGKATEENTTSLTFDGYAMGFFGGMVAAESSLTDRVAVLAAFEWQPEVQGFKDGAIFQNPEAQVDTFFVHDWDDVEIALNLTDELIKRENDVVYPAGDGYNVHVIERMKEKGLYVIGYVSEQSDLGQTTVLTSTVQHVDKLYLHAAELFNQDKLESGNLVFDFQDDVISMGKYSPVVEESFQEKMRGWIEHYKKTGKLPNS